MTTIAFLNHQYLPLSEAKISPMDRGFLFGDGIYEVIPSFGGRIVGFSAHMQRMENGLRALEIENPFDRESWQRVIQSLLDKNGAHLGPSIGVYLHVSRGMEMTRNHGYSENLTPTVFAFAFRIPPSQSAHPDEVKGLHVSLAKDLRWQRCHIKSTSLLGNVLHFQEAKRDGKHESILFNHQNEITEATTSNVFIVEQGIVRTPPLDNQLLPGITRKLLIESLINENIQVEEVTISTEKLMNADEIWLTSSSKEVAPVVSVDDNLIGDGKPGPLWRKALLAYDRYKFN
ncbi:D-amino acid aminotransferase [Alteromonas ponticola]|uniref:D-amino acid aminotransferase n=1 Tax=Alteromonas aquimaris TaxID=2998417 RepID=A0ABT3P9B5_9ALTE|nr:D-amino acid aminotransferase [Alteromonas aquimaris]MCW8108676.1 D-amino acid aminotransferase [Alteromonas aquimaris]